MPKIGDYKESHELPCTRCGSKRKVGKKRTEKVNNANSAGYMVLEHTQIICTNKTCQIEFEQKIIEEEAKREKLKADREKKSAKPVSTA